MPSFDVKDTVSSMRTGSVRSLDVVVGVVRVMRPPQRRTPWSD
jgi:hypothetical protein